MPRLATPRARQLGVTVLELMIGTTIGLIASLVIVQVFSQSEAHRRSTQGAADSHQVGTIATWRLMRDLRMAGNGLQHGPTLWGCGLEAWRDGAQRVPRAGGWPAPFAAVPGALQVAPIVAIDGGGNAPDTLVVMSARGGAGATPMPASVVTPTELNTTSSVAYAPRDVLMMADMSAIAPCRIGEVAAGYAAVPGQPAPKIVPTGAPGSGFNAPDGFGGLAANRDYALYNFGTAPSIVMYGVANGSLVQLDALAAGAAGAPTVQAENVESLQVLLGVDDGVGGTANDNVVDRWIVPGTGAFTPAAMFAGGLATLQVKAIRLAVVTRAAEPSQRAGPAEIVVFPDLAEPLRVRIPVAAADRAYARQVHDLVIPLRNQWVALCSEDRRAQGLPAPGACE